MNKNKKTILTSIIAVALFVGLFFVVKNLNKPVTTEGDKSIHIVILDKEQNKVYDETLSTDSLLLGELLDEINDNEETFIFDGTKDSEFGRFIKEIKLVETEEGEFWVFGSDNNKACLEAEFCPGADVLAIEDKDSFTFEILLPAHEE